MSAYMAIQCRTRPTDRERKTLAWQISPVHHALGINNHLLPPDRKLGFLMKAFALRVPVKCLVEAAVIRPSRTKPSFGAIPEHTQQEPSIQRPGAISITSMSEAAPYFTIGKATCS